MAADDVAGMPNVGNFGPVAPAFNQVSSMADVGQLSSYNAKLHNAHVAGFKIPDAVLGEAVCIVHKAASKMNGGAEPAAMQLENTVNDIKQQLDSIAQRLGQLDSMAQRLGQLDSIAQRLGHVEGKQDSIEAKVDRVEATQGRIEAKHDNIESRSWNRMSQGMDHPLKALKAETGANIGRYPQQGIFPVILGDVGALNAAALDLLASFYGRPFPGVSAAARQNNFKCFIGTIV